jgi:HAD superfamily hydrolase (TIGR01509 family)
MRARSRSRPISTPRQTIFAVVIPGVIFDCDGVLVDTEPAANRVLAELLTAAGLPTTAEESMRTYMGRSWSSCMAIAAERLGRPLPAGLRDEYRARVRAAWSRELRAVDGIAHALDRIGLPTCVASSGEHERMRFTLGHTGLLARFEGRIFSATEVERGKPAPDLFLHAAAEMAFDPGATTVVEDTVPGVEAGRAAGMRVLAYARLTPAADLEAAGGEPFDDMRDLPALLDRGAQAGGASGRSGAGGGASRWPSENGG